MGHIHDDILGTVGRTPVIRINKLAPGHVNMFVKNEAIVVSALRRALADV